MVGCGGHVPGGPSPQGTSTSPNGYIEKHDPHLLGPGRKAGASVVAGPGHFTEAGPVWTPAGWRTKTASPMKIRPFSREWSLLCG